MDFELIEKKIENHCGEYIITSKDIQWKKYQEAAKKKLTSKLEVSGFRKGHIPAEIAKKHINSKNIMTNALNSLINDFNKHLKQSKEIKIYPFNIQLMQLNIESFDENKAIIKFTFPLIPFVDASKWKDVKINFDAKSKFDLEKALSEKQELLVKQKTEYKLVEDPKYLLKNDDIAVIDFTGKFNGKEFPGGSAKKYELTIGSNQFIPGFEKQLISMKTNDSRTIKVTFPEIYPQKEYAGKDAEFDIYLHEIRTKSATKFNDDFIKSLNLKEISNVKQWNELTKKEIQTQHEQQAKFEKEDILLKNLIDNIPIKISTQILDIDYENTKKHFFKRIEELKVPKELFFAQMQKDEEEVLKQIKEDSENKIKLTLLMGAIANIEKINANENSYHDWIKNNAKLNNISEKEMEIKVPLTPETILRIRNELTWNVIKKYYLKDI